MGIVPDPQTPLELAEVLRIVASRGNTISLGGHGSKRRMAGAIAAAERILFHYRSRSRLAV